MGRPQVPTDTIVKCCISVGHSFVSCLYCKGKDTYIFLQVFKFKMATGQSGEMSGETFPDIEVECDDAIQGKLALQLHISKPGNHPLPVGVITERSLMTLVKRVTNYTPIIIMIMNDLDSVIEFGKGARMFEVAQPLQALNVWDHYQVEVGTILATKSMLVDIIQE